MFLNFYVYGSDPSTSNTHREGGYFDAIKDWTRETAAKASFRDAVECTKSYLGYLWDRSKSGFRYLSGESANSPPILLPPEMHKPAPFPESTSKSWYNGLFGSFRTLGGKEAQRVGEKNKYWTEGEVHAELIQVGHQSSCLPR